MTATLSTVLPGLLAAAILRPRLGQFPLILLGLCLLWIGLLRAALPGFGRRLTIAALLGVVLLIGSWLPRVASRSWGGALLTPLYYKGVILPATVVEMAMLGGLVSAPLWVPLGWLSRRRRRRPGPDPAATPAVDAAPAVDATPAMDAAPAVDAALAVAPPDPPPPGISRREVLGALAWTGPTTALVLGGYGVFRGAQQLVVRRVRLSIPGLPAELDGLRVGQLTDAHIARDLTPIGQIERACELLSAERLDLLCATGDLCDETALLPEVLRLLAQVPTRLGNYSCLGNHELYLGLPRVRREHERAGLHLLEDDRAQLGRLRLSGISFPHSGRPRLAPQMIPGLLDRALGPPEAADPAHFTLMLSHHPHVIQHVGGRGVGLMLSGHTHGGQLGIGERSVLEPFYGFVRGPYEVPQAGAPVARLYVSSGVGHWLPFRLNCPAEVAIVELVRA